MMLREQRETCLLSLEAKLKLSLIPMSKNIGSREWELTPDIFILLYGDSFQQF